MDASLGLGKSHRLLHALYRLAATDPTRSIKPYTALPLTRRLPKLEQRFVQPFLDCHFGAAAVDPQYAPGPAHAALPSSVAMYTSTDMPMMSPTTAADPDWRPTRLLQCSVFGMGWLDSGAFCGEACGAALAPIKRLR